MAGYLNSNYTQDQVNSVPGLSSAIANFVNSQGPAARNRQMAALPGFINNAMSNPVAFVESELPKTVVQYESNPASSADINSALQQQAQYLNGNGVSPGEVNTLINQGLQNYSDIQTQKNEANNVVGGPLGVILDNPTTVAEIAAAATIPGAAEALAPSIAAALSVSTATATAIAAGTLSAATQVAAGVPVNEAIQNAAISTVISTGTTEAAQSIISNNPGTSVATVLSTPVPGAAAGSLSPVVSAVSQGLSSGISAELTGKNVAQAVEKGAAIGGISSAAAQEASALTSPGTTKSTGLSYQKVTDPTTGAQTEYFPGLGGMSKVNVSGDPMIPAGTGVGLIGSTSEAFPNFNPAYTTPDTTPMTIGPDGSLIPAYQSAESAILPTELQQYLPAGSETPAEQAVTETITPGLSKAAQEALQTAFGFGLGLIGPKSQPSFGVPADTGASTAAKTGSTSSTTGGGPGGTELDPSTGKAPQQVWGEDYKSLKEGLNV